MQVNATIRTSVLPDTEFERLLELLFGECTSRTAEAVAA